MPFTISHAAAALPLFRVNALRPAALVIGTMVPDLSMFCGSRRERCYEVTHSLVLSVPVGVLFGLCLLLAFEWSKEPLVSLLPAPLQAKLAPYVKPVWPRGLREVLLCAVSVALGVVTHIVWDAFTHSSQFGVRMFPFIKGVWIPSSPIGPVRGYKVLQHISGIVGISAVALYVARGLWRLPSVSLPAVPVLSAKTRTLVLSTLALLIPLLCIAYAYRATPGTGFEFWRVFARAAVTKTFAAQGAGLICAVIGIKWLHARSVQRP